MLINKLMDDLILGYADKINESRYQAILRVISIINPTKFDVPRVTAMYDRYFTLFPIKNYSQAFID